MPSLMDIVLQHVLVHTSTVRIAYKDLYLYKRLMRVCWFVCCNATCATSCPLRRRHCVGAKPRKKCVTKSLRVFVDDALGTKIGELTKACEQASLTVVSPSNCQLLSSRTPFSQTPPKNCVTKSSCVFVY